VYQPSPPPPTRTERERERERETYAYTETQHTHTHNGFVPTERERERDLLINTHTHTHSGALCNIAHKSSERKQIIAAAGMYFFMCVLSYIPFDTTGAQYDGNNDPQSRQK